MSEKMRNISVAYTKGAKAYHKRGATCPYGETKRELSHWWFLGFDDASKNNLDASLIKKKRAEARRTVTPPEPTRTANS